jgi:hypothetical protein
MLCWMGWRPSKNVGKPDHLWRVCEGSLLTCQGRLRSFWLHLTERTPVNGAQSDSHGNHMKPAINDGPNNNTVFVLHSAKLLLFDNSFTTITCFILSCSGLINETKGSGNA